MDLPGFRMNAALRLHRCRRPRSDRAPEPAMQIAHNFKCSVLPQLFAKAHLFLPYRA